MKYSTRLFFMVAITLITNNTNGQGCSDAGFCTITSLQPGGLETTKMQPVNQLTAGISNGKADYDISIWSAYITYSRQLNEKLGMDVKLTFLRQHSDVATSSGLSDIFATANYAVNKNMQLIAGIKLPVTNGNKKKGGLPLPMDFQTSLGTTDLILGMGYKIHKMEWALALQQPLTQNKNTFLSSRYTMESPLYNFQSTNKYIRKGDVLLRVSYPVTLKEKWTLIPGVLPIYHLANDEYTDAAGQKKEIPGSKGLTLNATMFLQYAINKNNLVALSAGTPLAARDTRPDGLTRKYVVALEYKCRF